MLDPANDLLPPPSSPTNSSISSSDLDTEVVKAIFHFLPLKISNFIDLIFRINYEITNFSSAVLHSPQAHSSTTEAPL